jgi:hypothetical protein
MAKYSNKRNKEKLKTLQLWITQILCVTQLLVLYSIMPPVGGIQWCAFSV